MLNEGLAGARLSVCPTTDGICAGRGGGFRLRVRKVPGTCTGYKWL